MQLSQQQHDLNQAAARRPEGREQSANQMERGIGGFLFLQCLGLGFVLDLFVPD